MRSWLPLSALLLAFVVLFSCQKSAKPVPPAGPGSTPPGAAVTAASRAAATQSSVTPPRTQPGTGQPAPSQPASTQPAMSPTAPGSTPSTPAGSAAAPAAPGGTQPAGQPETAGASPQASLTKGIVLSRQPAQTGQPKPVMNAATLMALGRDKHTLPEDFKIGPLGDDHAGKAELDGAMAAAQAFLAGLVAGSVDRKLLTTDSQASVSDTLAYGLEQGYTPKSFRLGAPKSQDDGTVTATVRLFGAEGTSEGEIYLARTGKEWLVADLQLSLAQLAVKREAPKEKFFPSAYRWLLED